MRHGNYKLGDSRNKFDNIPEHIKTKQVFFKTRNMRNLMPAGHSSPSVEKGLPKYDTSKKKHKKMTSIGKKTKSN